MVINSRNPESVGASARKITEDTGSTCHVARRYDCPILPAAVGGRNNCHVRGTGHHHCQCRGPPAGSFETFDDAAWQYALKLQFMSQVRLIRCPSRTTQILRCQCANGYLDLSEASPAWLWFCPTVSGLPRLD